MTTATAPTRKKQNRPNAPVPPAAEQVQEQPRSEAERIRAEIAAAQQARQDIETKLAEMRKRLAGAVEAEREAARVAWTRDAQDAIRQAAFNVPGRLLMLFVLDRLAISWELDDDSLKDFRDEIDASARPTLKALLAVERRIKDDDVTIAGLQNPSPELMRELARVWKVPLPAESNGHEIAPGYLDKPLANGLNRVREGDLEFVRFADGEVAVFIAGVKIEPPADEVLAQARTALMLDEPVAETPTAPTPERSTRKRRTATPPPEVATTDADYLREAEELVRAEGRCAISLLQRRLGIGYTRASNLRDQLKAAGIINDSGDLVAAHPSAPAKPSESAETARETCGPARTDELATEAATPARQKFLKIEGDVADVLRSRLLFHGNDVKIGGPRLDPKLYKRVDAVLRELGGKWKGGKTQAHVFPSDPKSLVGEAVGNGKVLNKQQSYQFFETPADVAKRLVQLANIDASCSVLEPSAGRGAIARAIDEAQPLSMTLVELDRAHHSRLCTFKADVYSGDDFLTWKSPKQFDRIVMNPPFAGGQDADHVRHAFGMLNPGGRLVAIVGEGVFTRSDKKCVAFRDFVERYQNQPPEVLPAGTFADSGTDARARIIVLDKPASTAGPARTDETILPPVAGILNGSLYTPEELGTTAKLVDHAHHAGLAKAIEQGSNYSVGEYTLALPDCEWPWIAVTPNPFDDLPLEDGELWLLPLVPVSRVMEEQVGSVFSGKTVKHGGRDVKVGNLALGYRVKIGGGK